MVFEGGKEGDASSGLDHGAGGMIDVGGCSRATTRVWPFSVTHQSSV